MTAPSSFGPPARYAANSAFNDARNLELAKVGQKYLGRMKGRAGLHWCGGGEVGKMGGFVLFINPIHFALLLDVLLVSGNHTLGNSH